jgi:hypothetical protein
MAAPLVIAGLAAGEATGVGDVAGVDRGLVGVGAALGVRDDVGAAQPASKIESKATANIFIVNWTVRLPPRLCKGSMSRLRAGEPRLGERAP